MEENVNQTDNTNPQIENTENSEKMPQAETDAQALQTEQNSQNPAGAKTVSPRQDEEKSVQEKQLSAEELYAKTETEKLLKKKKKKRLATLAGLAVAFCLAIVVIVLAVVPVSLSPKCLAGGFDYVCFYSGLSNVSGKKTFDRGDAGYDRVMNAYKKSFGQTYLSALFSGSLSGYEISELVNGARTAYTGENQVLGLLDSGDYCLYVRFNEERTLTNRNGRVYSSRYSGGTSAWPDGKIVFSEAYVEVNRAGGFVGTRIFVVGRYPVIENRQPTGAYDSYVVTVTVRADTSALYGIWADLPTV